ncbi:MAG: MmcQ/YjbR family DNA-binding protein [Oscillospiraceae bacterium]|nr:MmcQ/YjbR family DNA-binding protein [Oscillospiraceae bacterium]
MIQREEIFAYVKERYGVTPDYPLPNAPTFPVMRHADNRKWFALIMDVQREKLGLPGSDRVDIINVKLSDPLLVDVLAQQPGYRYGYHISRGCWISILLDGTVPPEEIFKWIDESYLVTASKYKKKAARPPKEWIIPTNPKYYDVTHAFDGTDEVLWTPSPNVRIGDTVYLYVAAPVSAIVFQCAVVDANLPDDYENRAKLKLLRRYPPEKFQFSVLKEDYGVFAVRGPRGVPHRLSAALNR